MSKGHYDREAPSPDDNSIVFPRRSTQETYHYLRHRRSEAVAKHWAAICDHLPEVRDTDAHLQALLEDNPNTPFAIVRPDDLLATDQAGSPVFLR